MKDKSDYTICKSYDGENNCYKTYYTLRDEIINSIYKNVDEDIYKLIEENLEDIEEIIDQIVDEVNYNETQLNLYEYKFKQLKLFKENPIKWYESQFGKLKWYQKIQLMFLLWKERL